MAYHLLLVRHRHRRRRDCGHQSGIPMKEVIAEFTFIGGIIAICTILTMVACPS